MYKFLLCWRYLRTRYIALVTIVSVMLGVATMIVVNAVMEGFTHEMQERIHGILSDLVFTSHRGDGLPDANHYAAFTVQYQVQSYTTGHKIWLGTKAKIWRSSRHCEGEDCEDLITCFLLDFLVNGYWMPNNASFNDCIARAKASATGWSDS